jgi:hypothetical protein
MKTYCLKKSPNGYNLSDIRNLLSAKYCIGEELANIVIATIDSVALSEFTKHPTIIARNPESGQICSYVLTEGRTVKQGPVFSSGMVVAIDEDILRSVQEHRRNQNNPRLSPAYRRAARMIIMAARNGILFS